MATELEELIVRLVGDSSEFQSMMKGAVSDLQDSASEMKQAARETESFKGKLEELASTAASAFAAIGLGGGLRDLLNTWTVQEDALVTLNAAIQVNERNVEGLFEQYQAFASSMQAVTTTGDEVTLQMLQQAESFGVTGDAAMRAARNAISLGAATGMAAQAAMRMTVMLEQGNTMMLTRYIPSLRNITDEGARVAEAHRVLNNMFAVATARAGTTSGRMQQLANTWGDMKEILGQVVAVGIMPFVRWLKMVVDGFHALDPQTKAMISNTIVFTMAVTGLSAALRVLSALALLIQRRFIVLLALSAGVAYIMQQFGGFDSIMRNFENSVNNVLQIDPQTAFSAQNGMYNAGMGLGEALEKGLAKGSEGVEGILLGTAAAAGAIFAYVSMIQGAKVNRPTGAGAAGGAALPSFSTQRFEDTWFGSQFQEQTPTFWQTMENLARQAWTFIGNFAQGVWSMIQNVALGFWNMLPPWAQNALTAVFNFLQGVWSTVAEHILARLGISEGQARATIMNLWNAAYNLGAYGNTSGTPPATGGVAPITSVPQTPWNPPGMQHGGPVSAGSPYVVGENGPELFMPNTGGRIIPNAQSRGFMGGSAGGNLAILQLINEQLKLIRRQKLMVGVGRIG